MIRTFVSFPITNIKDCKKQLLEWANQFTVCCFFDNHHYPSLYHSYECLVGAGVAKTFTASEGSSLQQLAEFASDQNDWLFGHFNYDLKNELENLESAHQDRVGFPPLFFFVPETVILVEAEVMHIGCLEDISPFTVYNQVVKIIFPDVENKHTKQHIRSRFTRDEYIGVIKKLQAHILKGDCYEINFCQEFYQEDAAINPLELYRSLSRISPNPFAAYYKLHEFYLCCASPERYLRKDQSTLVAQPIKGTAPRNFHNNDQDASNRDELRNSAKEKAENVMIVDLARNDLSKVSERASITVAELFGIYSYPQVHQMISTITGKMKNGLNWVDVIRATFPMGSMTGAPKKRVMELIEEYERSKRGLFSGSVGYVTPSGDFDFNVVIRSILYNSKTRYLSYQVGSAITFQSDPEKEYEECMLKAAAIKVVLSEQTL